MPGARCPSANQPSVVVWEADGTHGSGGGYGGPLARKLRDRGHRVGVVALEERSPDPTELAAPAHVLSGGNTSATCDTDWVCSARSALRAVLDRAREGGAEVVGVCFGAQLLATAIGGLGAVGPAEGGMEVGLARVHPRSSDSTTGRSHVVAQFHHHQIAAGAIRSSGASVTLSNDHTEVQAFEVGEHIVGYQFHPEWSPADVAATISRYRRVITETGGCVTRGLATVADRYGHWDPLTFDRLVAARFDGGVPVDRTYGRSARSAGTELVMTA